MSKLASPELRHQVERWVSEGIIDDAQARAILRREGAAPRSADRGDTTVQGDGGAGAERGAPGLLTELAVDAAVVIAVFTGSMALGRVWADLGAPVRVSIGVALAAMGQVLAWFVRPVPGAPGRRLTGVFQAVTAGGIAVAIASALVGAGVDAPELVAIVTGSAVAAFGAWRWGGADRPVEWIVTVAGTVGATVGVLGLLDAPPWTGGVLAMVISAPLLVWGGAGRIRPGLVVEVTGAIGLVVGAGMLGDLLEASALFVTAAAGAIVVVVGAVRRHAATVVVGAVSFVGAVQGIVFEYLGGPVAATTVALAAVAAVFAVVTRSGRRSSPPGSA